MANRLPHHILRRIFGRTPADEIASELDHHIEERIREYIARGLSPEEAQRTALERLGDVDRVRAECVDLLTRERRSRDRRARLIVSWLDVKLGVRMLLKFPGLSSVSVIGMAVAIAVGAGAFAFIQAIMDPSLPLEGGDRIVSIQNNRTDEAGNPERRVLHDFVMWRDALESVRDLGAFRSDRRNLMTADGSTELVRVAEMSAAGFRVADIPALMGRTLLDEDEREGGEAVVVIGYDEWQRRFDGDPGIIGSTIRLGETVHTVIGVMPAGFRFPLNHLYWTPFRLDPSDWTRGTGPALQVFGRLAEGVSLKQAQAELATVGQRMTAQFPDTHEYLRPQVMPYALPFFDVDSPLMAMAMRGLQVVMSLLLVVVAVNVSILIYARTTTRLGEIAVRTALGASRRRVLAQLFVEALVVSVVAAAVGLTITGIALGSVESLLDTMTGGELPFWFSLDVSPALIGYAGLLAIVGGAIVGVFPALKATGRNIQTGLQQLAARGSQMQLGRTWTMLVITQVAFAVAILPAAVFWPGVLVSFGAGDPGFATDEFVSGRLSMEREEAPPTARATEYERELTGRFADRRVELLRRLEAEPGIEATFASSFPGRGELPVRVEFETSGVPAGDIPEPTPAEDRSGRRSLSVLVNHVGVNLFEMFDVATIAGRTFVEADVAAGSRAVIVNQTFAERIAGGANAVGRRIRYADRAGAAPDDSGPEQWYEIVGVVPDFPEPMMPELLNAAERKLYHPLPAGDDGSTTARLDLGGTSLMLIARARGRSGASLTSAVRNITAAVDPALQLHELSTETATRRTLTEGFRMVALGLIVATASILLLSAAGIYAMMSFTVARRRREIGIRTALGADARRILSGIFARAGAQLGIGVSIGLLFAILLEAVSGGLIMGGRAPIILPAVAAVVLTVGLLATLGPARRGLAVQPTEALRQE